MALYGAGVLTIVECNEIERGLDAVGQRLAAGVQPTASDEDVHTLIDRLLHEEIGDVASKLHTGRSRNDQVATATRMWAMDAAGQLDAARAAAAAGDDRSGAWARDVADAVVHAPAARHSGVGGALAARRISGRWSATARACAPRSDQPPCCPWARARWPDVRTRSRACCCKARLGFDAVSPNSIDAVSDRDFVAELLFSAAMIGGHLSRLAEDLIIYGSSEFGFVQFGDRFTSGSSMMPQKRNPDALELARGSAARMLGDLTTLLATLKGLPSSYNKDLQDDKRIVFDAVDTLLLVLPAVAGALAECAFRGDRMRAALSSDDDGDRPRRLSRAEGRDLPRGARRGRATRADCARSARRSCTRFPSPNSRPRITPSRPMSSTRSLLIARLSIGKWRVVPARPRFARSSRRLSAPSIPPRADGARSLGRRAASAGRSRQKRTPKVIGRMRIPRSPLTL